MLVFVYNADSGRLNALLDSAHKLLSPATYSCRLCELTYGLASEKREWQAFRQSLSEPVVFLHRDEFFRAYPDLAQTVDEFPVLLRLQDNHDAITLLDAPLIASAGTTAELIALCRSVI